MLRKIGLWGSVALIAFWMLAGGTAHILKPEFFFPFVPNVLPQKLTVYASGLVELAIGVCVLIPRTRALAGLAFAALCVAFLPLHVWDLFRDDPAITPMSAAIIRIFVQFFLIWVGYRLWQRGQNTP